MMTLVVKIGGGAGIATLNIVRELARYRAEGQQIVLLHGGSDLTNTLSEQMGHAVRMITSPTGMTSRYTDSETLRILRWRRRGRSTLSWSRFCSSGGSTRL